MSNNKLRYQTRSCKMQEAKNNPQYLVELPSCAWARRRRIWHERKFAIRDPDSTSTLTQTPYIKSLTKRYKQRRMVELPMICNRLNQVSLSVFMLFYLIISSNCLYYENKENAHTKKQQQHNLISNYLSPLEGK